MALIANVSIDVTKIDKSKLVKGKYYNLTITVNDTKDQYENDVTVTEPQTKEQRAAKEKKVYLGNGRVNWQG